ncbi:hypothetical protein Tco_0109717 [Tanacetum coccineum]
MTRRSTKELFTPFKELEREFRSSRKHFKTLSLDESRSPDFNLFSDQEEYSKEEVAKTMAETMEQYMSKTRADYGSGVARPKIEDKDKFELKGQFLKELRDNTFSGSDHKDANEHIEKVLEIEVVLFYNGLDVSTRQILDSRGAIPSKTAADAKNRAMSRSVVSKVYAAHSRMLNNVKVPHYTKIVTTRKKGDNLNRRKLGCLSRGTSAEIFVRKNEAMLVEDTLSKKFMSESDAKKDMRRTAQVDQRDAGLG